ncbi:hypothetical protein DZC72_12435 [Maribacter algicola]|uniref:Uncharacterized protein n=1 Tax=Maribacter algicola TaxID=2498892 RepID=A0A3R8WEE1_9FLAO|nr:hypothetical protein DZC72_12435 [Maribacter algicola]
MFSIDISNPFKSYNLKIQNDYELYQLLNILEINLITLNQFYCWEFVFYINTNSNDSYTSINDQHFHNEAVKVLQ